MRHRLCLFVLRGEGVPDVLGVSDPGLSLCRQAPGPPLSWPSLQGSPGTVRARDRRGFPSRQPAHPPERPELVPVAGSTLAVGPNPISPGPRAQLSEDHFAPGGGRTSLLRRLLRRSCEHYVVTSEMK